MNIPAAIHALALATCFMAHFAFADEFDGVRRALQTLSPTATVAKDVAAETIADLD